MILNKALIVAGNEGVLSKQCRRFDKELTFESGEPPAECIEMHQPEQLVPKTEIRIVTALRWGGQLLEALH